MVHRRSEITAAAVEEADDEGPAEGVEQDMYLVFVANEQEYGIQAMKVQEISAMINVTKIPKAPAYMEGILNLRGRLVSVINFRKRFGFAAIPNDEDTRIIIMDHEGFPIGLMADRVEEVIRIPDDKVQKLPETTAAGLAEDFVTGVGMLESRLIVLLDVEKLISKSEEVEANGSRKIQDALTAATATAGAQGQHEKN